MLNPSQEPPATSKAPTEDIKDMDVLCTFKLKIKSQNSENLCIKDQWPYPNQDQDAKPQSGTSIIIQSYKSGLKGHGFSLHLEDPCSLSPHLGLSRMPEVLDWGLASWSSFEYGQWSLIHPWSQVQLSILILKVQRTSMSFKYSFGDLEDAGGSWLGFGIFLLI